jgi:hypothetical protein
VPAAPSAPPPEWKPPTLEELRAIVLRMSVDAMIVGAAIDGEIARRGSGAKEAEGG